MFKVSVEKGNLVVTIPLQEPKESSSKKTMVVATTGGNQKTGVTLKDGPGKDKELIVGLTAYYKP